jgi:hypothetical protein
MWYRILHSKWICIINLGYKWITFHCKRIIWQEVIVKINFSSLKKDAAGVSEILEPTHLVQSRRDRIRAPSKNGQTKTSLQYIGKTDLDSVWRGYIMTLSGGGGMQEQVGTDHITGRHNLVSR